MSVIRSREVSMVFNVNGRAIGTSPLIEVILYMYGFSC